MPVSSFDELFKKIEELLQEGLETDVVDAVIKQEQKDIQTYVYDVYTPRRYKRKKKMGGLQDPENFRVTPIPHGVQITSKRLGENTYHDLVDVSWIVYYGIGYSIPDVNNYGYGKPRKFTEYTRRALKAKNSHVTALSRFLKKRGIQVDVSG